jgi:hypothetical protein
VGFQQVNAKVGFQKYLFDSTNSYYLYIFLFIDQTIIYFEAPSWISVLILELGPMKVGKHIYIKVQCLVASLNELLFLFSCSDGRIDVIKNVFMLVTIHHKYLIQKFHNCKIQYYST